MTYYYYYSVVRLSQLNEKEKSFRLIERQSTYLNSVASYLTHELRFMIHSSGRLKRSIVGITFSLTEEWKINSCASSLEPSVHDSSLEGPQSSSVVEGFSVFDSSW